MVPIYVLFVSIWVTFAFEKWKQREMEYSFVWNTLNYKEKEITRPNYDGIYIIDEITKEIRLQDPFPTRYRRWITTIPLLILGVGLILANFVFFIYLNDEIKIRTYNPAIKKEIYKVATGVGNGLIIFIFGMIYNFLAIKMINWENHRFQNSRESSLVTKTFPFDFTLAYINLFYYAFKVHDFNILAVNFISIVLTKNILFNFKTNLVPWFIYLIKKRSLLKKWKAARAIKKQKILEEQNINFTDFFDPDAEVVKMDKAEKKAGINEKLNMLSQEQRSKLLKLEKMLVLQEQIERTMIMARIPDLRLIWTNYAIQFGYISFFSLAFPLAPLIGFILNFFDLQFSYFALTDHVQRKICIEKGSIGIWSNIFMLMSYASLVVNLGILIFAPIGAEEFLEKLGFSQKAIDDNIIIYIAVFSVT